MKIPLNRNSLSVGNQISVRGKGDSHINKAVIHGPKIDESLFPVAAYYHNRTVKKLNKTAAKRFDRARNLGYSFKQVLKTTPQNVMKHKTISTFAAAYTFYTCSEDDT